jgi:DNA-binding CsgD family transcriptional regulator
MLYTDLTPRQIEILELLERGKNTKQISAELFIEPATTRNHVQAIMTALGAHSRLEAVYLWKTFRQPEERILRFCRREGIRVTQEQADIIRTAFAR